MTKFYNLVNALVKTLFKKDSPIIPEGAFHVDSPAGLVLAEMRTLVAAKKINEAENLVFDSLDKKQPVFLAIGLELYARLSELSEKELEEVDFSVEEIGDGIKDMMKFYGINLVAKNDPNAPKMKGIPVRPAGAPNGVPKVVMNPNAKPPVAPNVLADKPKGK